MNKLGAFYLILGTILVIVQLGECYRSQFGRRRFLAQRKTTKLPLKQIAKEKSLYADYCSQFSYFDQLVDHFNYDPKNNLKYKQRYVISDVYWRNGTKNNPIFFYTGNEGDIQWFCENTGFVWETAQKFNALVVFAEHRYYGTSLPFGNSSFENPNITFLTSEQALADYAYLITYLKSTRDEISDSPVIAFGGSYGGMLSAWFRMKYPNMVAGAIASSAPIWQMVTDCDSFSNVTTYAFNKADPKCTDIVRSSWDVINSFSQTASGLEQLTKTFRLCEPLKNGTDLKAWLNDMYGNIAMANYPYPADFLGVLPAWPVKVMCSNITQSYKNSRKDPLDVLEAIHRAANVYQNYSGDLKCIDIGDSTPFDVNMISWTYQTCTEFVFPTCSNGKTDMFEPQSWDYNAYSDACNDQFQTRPRAEWPILYYGGSAKDIRAHSNIAFPNGELDPWSAGGVLQDVNDDMPAFIIQYGAHHLDLRSANPADPESVIQARMREIDLIAKWVDEYANLK